MSPPPRLALIRSRIIAPHSYLLSDMGRKGINGSVVDGVGRWQNLDLCEREVAVTRGTGALPWIALQHSRLDIFKANLQYVATRVVENVADDGAAFLKAGEPTAVSNVRATVINTAPVTVEVSAPQLV